MRQDSRSVCLATHTRLNSFQPPFRARRGAPFSKERAGSVFGQGLGIYFAVLLSVLSVGNWGCSDEETTVGQVGCEPTTCEEAAATCGRLDDGCGAELYCGACRFGSVCTANQCQCTPDCSGKVCGDDGCGGSCGGCSGGEFCNLAGQCQIKDANCDNSSTCQGQICGPDPLCGLSCGDCGRLGMCNEVGQCNCTPDCTGRACGDDGCNGSCGRCAEGEFCNDTFQCEAGEDPTPMCKETCAEDECGMLDNGCGGTIDCGMCEEPPVCKEMYEPDECGMLDNNCGGTIDCGACPDSCPEMPVRVGQAQLDTQLVFTSGMAALAGDALYVRTRDSSRQYHVERIALDGSGSTTVHTTSFIGQIAAADDTVVFERQVALQTTGPHELVTVPARGGTPRVLFSTQGTARDSGVLGLVMDERNIFAITLPDNEPASAPYGVMRIERSSGSITRMSDCLNDSRGFACNGLTKYQDRLTWAGAAPKPPGSDPTQIHLFDIEPTPMASPITIYDSGAVHEYAQDESHVYWADYQPGEIYRAPLTGDIPELVGSVDGVTTGRLLLSEDDVIFANVHHPGFSGRQTRNPGIFKVAKSGGTPQRIVQTSTSLNADEIRVLPLGLWNGCLVYGDAKRRPTTLNPAEFDIYVRSID